MLYLVTRNRLGQPLTTDMDEFVDGKATGKIVVASRSIDGKYVPIYKGEEPFEPDPKKFQLWFQKYFGTKLVEKKPKKKSKQKTKQKTFAETLGQPKGEKYEVYVLEFDWVYGHRKEDCESREHAVQRQEKWQKRFYWAEFTDFKIHKEIRYRQPTT